MVINTQYGGQLFKAGVTTTAVFAPDYADFTDQGLGLNRYEGQEEDGGDGIDDGDGQDAGAAGDGQSRPSRPIPSLYKAPLIQPAVSKEAQISQSRTTSSARVT